MSNNANRPNVIFSTALATTEGNVRALLVQDRESTALQLIKGRRHLATVPVPASVSAFDLPYWLSSVVRTAVPAVRKTALSVCEDEIRRQIPSTSRLVSVCVGPMADFHLCRLLHIDPNAAVLGLHGTTFAITATIAGLRFSKGSQLAIWTIIFRAKSKRCAQALQKQILESGETLVSLDQGVEGIIAFNCKHWRTAGLNAQEVLKFAEQQKVLLIQEDADGPGLAFQVVEPKKA